MEEGIYPKGLRFSLCTLYNEGRMCYYTYVKYYPRGNAAARMRGKMSTTAEKAAVYDESKIKTLSSLEHIRLRTGMYIGRLGDGSNLDDGIYVLLKEVIDNSVDEYIMGVGISHRHRSQRRNRLSSETYGRGIPLGK